MSIRYTSILPEETADLKVTLAEFLDFGVTRFTLNEKDHNGFLHTFDKKREGGVDGRFHEDGPLYNAHMQDPFSVLGQLQCLVMLKVLRLLSYSQNSVTFKIVDGPELRGYIDHGGEFPYSNLYLPPAPFYESRAHVCTYLRALSDRMDGLVNPPSALAAFYIPLRGNSQLISYLGGLMRTGEPSARPEGFGDRPSMIYSMVSAGTTGLSPWCHVAMTRDHNSVFLHISSDDQFRGILEILDHERTDKEPPTSQEPAQSTPGTALQQVRPLDGEEYVYTITDQFIVASCWSDDFSILDSGATLRVPMGVSRAAQFQVDLATVGKDYVEGEDHYLVELVLEAARRGDWEVGFAGTTLVFRSSSDLPDSVKQLRAMTWELKADLHDRLQTYAQQVQGLVSYANFHIEEDSNLCVEMRMGPLGGFEAPEINVDITFSTKPETFSAVTTRGETE